MEENVEKIDNKMSDFVEDLQKQIMKDIPYTSPYWAEDIAISLLSTVSGSLHFSTKIGRVPSNVWFMAIAQSARGYKSPPLNYFLRPIIKQMEIDSGNLNWKLSLPSSFSMEGMTEYLTKNSKGVIINDEMSQLFKATQGKGYTVSLMEFLDKLFDGIVEPRYTRQYKLEELPHGAYVSLVGATTPTIYRVLDYDSFTSGFGMRFLYELWDPTAEISYSKEQLFGVKDEARPAIFQQYSKVLSKIFSKELIDAQASPNVLNLFTKYRQELENKAVNEETHHNQEMANYIEKVSLYLFKLAPLFALSRQVELIAESPDKTVILPIEERDVERAYYKIIRHISNFQKVLSNWNSFRNSKPVVISDYSSVYDSIFGYLQQAGGILTLRELAAKMGWVDVHSSAGIASKYNEIMKNAIREKNLQLLGSAKVRELPPKLLEKLNIKTKDKNGASIKKLPYIIALPEYRMEIREVIG